MLSQKEKADPANTAYRARLKAWTDVDPVSGFKLQWEPIMAHLQRIEGHQPDEMALSDQHANPQRKKSELQKSVVWFAEQSARHRARERAIMQELTPNTRKRVRSKLQDYNVGEVRQEIDWKRVRQGVQECKNARVRDDTERHGKMEGWRDGEMDGGRDKETERGRDIGGRVDADSI